MTAAKAHALQRDSSWAAFRIFHNPRGIREWNIGQTSENVCVFVGRGRAMWHEGKHGWQPMDITCSSMTATVPWDPFHIGILAAYCWHCYIQYPIVLSGKSLRTVHSQATVSLKVMGTLLLLWFDTTASLLPNDGVGHDDVIKWKHFPRYWSFVRGIQRSPVHSPHKGQGRAALMFPLICAWTNV